MWSEHRSEQPEEDEQCDNVSADESETIRHEETELIGYLTKPTGNPLLQRNRADIHHTPPPLAETVGSKYAYRVSAMRFMMMTASAMINTAAWMSG